MGRWDTGRSRAPRGNVAALAVSEVGRLFADTDTWLAVIDASGAVVHSSDGEGQLACHEMFSTATAAQVRDRLADAARKPADNLTVIHGRTVDDREIEVRIVRSRADGDYFLLLVRPLLEASADGAHSRVRELSAALQAVADIVIPVGEVQGHEDARRRAALVSSLTDRERHVALAVADGIRTSQIASDLFVSQSTVRNYLPIIYRKLGVDSRAALVELLNSAS